MLEGLNSSSENEQLTS